MPRGLPDFYNPSYNIAGSQRDFGELFPLLYKFNSCDSLGRIIYVDDFQGVITRWSAWHIGAAADPVLSNTYVDTGVTSAKLDGGAAAAGDGSFLDRDFLLQDLTRTGIEISFYSEIVGDLIDVMVSFFQGDICYKLEFYFWRDTGEICVTAADGDHTYMLDPGIANYQGFYQVKCVADPLTGMYSRLIIGQQRFDISDLSMDSYALSPLEYHCKVTIGSYNFVALADPSYIGHVILTVDEP
jgi:hypothetical protein